MQTANAKGGPGTHKFRMSSDCIGRARSRRMVLHLDPAVRLDSEEQDRGAIASIMLLLVDAPGAYGIGAARSRSGIARTWHCSRFRIGSTKISARSNSRLTCSRVTKLFFFQKNTMHISNANGKCKGRSRDTQVSNVVGLHGPRAITAEWLRLLGVSR